MSANQLSDARFADEGRNLQRYPQDDEISLFDLWDILVRRRRWIASVFVLTLVAAGAYLLLTPAVYESRAVVRLGRVAESPVSTAEIVALELREQYRVGEPGRELPYLESLEAGESGVLTLKASALSAEAAQSYLATVVEKLLAVQERRYEAGVRIQREGLAAVESQIAQLREQMERLLAVAEAGEAENSVRALVVLQQASLQGNLQALLERQTRLEQSLSPLTTYPAEAVRAPTLPEGQAAPKPRLVFALAAVLGAMLGVMAAFLAEFVQQARAREFDVSADAAAEAALHAD